MGLDDDFFALGGSSLSGAVLINRLQERLGEIVHVVAIFDAPTVSRLAAYLAAQHREAVRRVWGAASLGEAAPEAEDAAVDEVAVARFRSLIPGRPAARQPARRNPRAVFVLSPPRSGSTLLRVMLGGHPELFAPPELELLGFETLAERRAAFAGARDAFWLEGAVRAVMAALGCGPEEARAAIEGAESEGLSTLDFYGRLQGWLGGRTLVDKTPSYALSRQVLERAEAGFEAPFYIHLLRHPLAMVRSFEEAKLDQIFFRQAADPAHGFSRRQLAELIWVVSEQNVRELLAGIPAERQHQVRFEELVRDPEGVLRGLCAALGLAYEPAMARPYEAGETGRRMTDGLHAASRMLGDVKFHQHGRVDPTAAERWRSTGSDRSNDSAGSNGSAGSNRPDRADDAGTGRGLGEVARRLARAVGYELAGDAEARIATGGWEPGRPAPLSFAQERLWFLDQLAPESPLYNIPAGLRLAGRLDAGALERAILGVVRRHASLRTTFVHQEGRPGQVIAQAAAFRLPGVDLSGLPAASREAELRELADAEAGRPFDLARGPLLRALLLRLGGEEHALLLNLHHIVSDGWSLGVLVHEVTELYAAAVQSQPAALPELPVQYADYAAWQRRRLQGETLEAEIAYWRAALAGAEPLDLPADRPRPAVYSHRGAGQPVHLEAGTAAPLLALGAARGATPFMTLLAGFAVLLHRYAGQDDLSIGTPTAGRNHSDIEGLIGFFVNTLVMRLQVGSAAAGELPSFRELLDRARAAALGAFAHQELPFEKVVEALQPRRDPSRTPLFQVAFALLSAQEMAPAAELPGLVARGLPLGGEAAKFDLTLSLGADAAGGFSGAVSYNRDLFEPATMARFVRHLQVLLAGLGNEPDRPVAGLPLLSLAERHQTAVEWGRAEARYPRCRSIPSLLAEQARRAPEAVAVVTADGRDGLTYGELDREAELLARHLRALGVGLETRVGIFLRDPVFRIVAFAAVLRAGGAYVPLDPDYPAERLAWMLADSAAPVLVTEEALLGRLPGHSRVVVRERLVAIETTPGLTPGPWPRVPAAALACVFYTSGSTGAPKGVAVTHRGVVRLVRGTNFLQIGPADRIAQLSNVAFDAAVFEIWGPLLNGGRVVAVPREDVLAPARFEAALDGAGVTALFVTTAVFNRLTHEAPGVFANGRRVLFGGETCDPASVRRALAVAGPGRILHVYGPTESTTFTTWGAVHEVPGDAATVPIGGPVANSEVTLLDRSFQPVPAGVAGELCIGGDGLARGYLGRPELTAERFVPDPAARVPGARLYRSGDRARWLPGGAVEFLGRLDRQIKLRGFRIEPGEIESALAEHPAVREALVVDRRDGGAPGEAGDHLLVAYWVPREAGGEAVDPPDLRAFLQQRLPAFLVPAALVALPQLPLNAHGKVDRAALPVPSFGAGAGRTAPRTATEKLVAAIWAKLLGREQVGLEDDFFALGGHSLLATQVISRVRAALAIELPLLRLFEAPTVAGFAAVIVAAREAAAPAAASAPAAPAAALALASRQGELPLSFAQERLWFLDRLEPGRSTYNMPAALRLAGALDVAALRRCFAELVRRHEALRTTFGSGAGQPVQVIAAPAVPALPVADLAALPAAAREQELRRVSWREAERPFDLSAGPLLRLLLVRLGERDHGLSVTQHHIVSDGWSVGVLVREMGLLYAAFAAGLSGPPAELPELPVQYADFALWQRQRLQGPVLAAEIAYWKERLAGAPALELPTDRPRPALLSPRGAARRIWLEAATVAPLLALGVAHGATPFMTLLAGFAALLGRYAGQDDLSLGTPVAGRTRAEIEGLIGFFVNTLVLRLELSGRPAFVDLLDRVRPVALGAFDHQELPFEKVVEELQPRRDPSRTPLFQVLFAFQNLGDRPAADLPGLTVSNTPLRGTTAKFDLSLVIGEDGGGLTGALEYNRDLFEAATIARLIGHLGVLLAAAAAEPERPLPELPLLTAAERRQLADWGDGGGLLAGTGDLTLHGLFAAQAGRRPDAVALVAGEETWTYGALAGRARQLARHLQGLGVGPEEPVAVQLPRSAGLVAAVLGILEAGAIYQPLDPEQPRERRAWQLRDSGAAVVCTSRALLGELPESPARILLIDEILAAEPLPAGAAAEEPPAGPIDPDRLACLLYTSGSTGTPNGVLLAHRGIVHLLLQAADLFQVGPESRVLLATSIGFDASLQEVFLALVHGASLCAVDAEERLAPARLAVRLAEQQVSSAFFTPSYLELLPESDLPALRSVSVGGEALPLALAERWSRGGRRLVNGYGPAEATIFATAEVFTASGGGGEGRPPAIGRPMAGVEVRVVDAELSAVPAGVLGELVIGGVGLARGYLGQPAQTAERFVPDPSAEVAGERLYRTGDLGRWRPDGRLEFLGRRDQQVKIRGQRIELGEIEAALASHPAVGEATVLAVAEGPAGRWLAAFVVPRRPPPFIQTSGQISDQISAQTPGEAPDERELRAYLRSRLPAAMIPATITVLPSLPLTVNGKLDRPALARLVPDPARSRADSPERPRTAVEEVLAGIWAEVLSREAVGVEDDFFALGGHSLLATQVISRAAAIFRVDLPLRRLFEEPTVAGFAAAVCAHETRPGQSEKIARVLLSFKGRKPAVAPETLVEES